MPGFSSLQSRPFLIGVAGPSCAGKTELSKYLSGMLSASLVPEDCYYCDRSNLLPAERDFVNFDDPAALDHDLFQEHILALSQGRTIQRPAYDFATHTRTSKTEQIIPSFFVVVEGLFILHWEDVRLLLGTGVFVDLPDEECLERRILRDVSERGRTPESVRRQFRESVQPMAELYVQPSRAYADVVVAGNRPLRESAEAVLAHIGSRGVRLP